MCYSSIYDREWKKLHDIFDLASADPLNDKGQRFFPKGKTGVIAFSKKQNGLHLKEMTFGLKPHWASKDSYKSPPYNARINSSDPKSGNLIKIFEKPTWRSYFGTNNCIIPVTSFFEICDIEGGQEYRNEVRFDSSTVLYWAGIYSWHKEDEDYPLSFAGITTTPYELVHKIGHSRSPKFLNRSQAQDWLGGFSSQQVAYDFLETAEHTPSITYEKVRELKSP